MASGRMVLTLQPSIRTHKVHCYSSSWTSLRTYTYTLEISMVKQEEIEMYRNSLVYFVSVFLGIKIALNVERSSCGLSDQRIKLQNLERTFKGTALS